jgi:O-antigen/teichoic acid export membrane protein
MRTAALVAYRATSDVVGKAAFFVVTIVAARRLSAGDFGVFALGTTIGWMAVVASDFGLQLHLARAVARAPEAAGVELRRWLRMRVGLAAAALIVVALGIAVFDARRAAPSILLSILLFTVGYLAAGVVEFVHYFYRGLSRSDIESTLTLWHRGGLLVAASLALWLRPDVLVLAAAMVVPPVAAGIYTLRRSARMAATRSGPRGNGTRPLLPELVRDVAPIGAGIVLSALYFRIDVFLLEAWRGTETVGLYNAAFRLIEALRLFPAALVAVMLPTLVRAPGPTPLLRISTALTAFGVAVAAGLQLGAGRVVPMLYGAGFTEAVPAFRILAAAYPLMALNYALTHQVIGWNGHRAYAALCLGALIVNVALNTRLIPALSLNGAAWSTLATEALVTAGCIGILARTRSRRPAAAAAVAAT